MEQYFLRATQLFARTNGSFSDGAAMRVVLDRVRKDEWRMALAVATREVQSGKVTTLSQLRAVLQREALAEPSRPQQSSGGGPHRAQGAHKRQSVRAAAIEQEDSGTDEEDEPSSSVHAAPVAQRAPSSSRPSWNRCHRCKKSGHGSLSANSPTSAPATCATRRATSASSARCATRNRAAGTERPACRRKTSKPGGAWDSTTEGQTHPRPRRDRGGGGRAGAGQ